jgi:hypothetical protein
MLTIFAISNNVFSYPFLQFLKYIINEFRLLYIFATQHFCELANQHFCDQHFCESTFLRINIFATSQKCWFSSHKSTFLRSPHIAKMLIKCRKNQHFCDSSQKYFFAKMLTYYPTKKWLCEF